MDEHNNWMQKENITAEYNDLMHYVNTLNEHNNWMQYANIITEYNE